MPIHRLAVLTLAAVMAFAVPARADDDGDDHDLARRLLAEGQIRPLSAIVEEIKGQVPGEMLGVEFESEKGLYKYEIKILRPDGKVQEVEVDARTGTILKVEDDD